MKHGQFGVLYIGYDGAGSRRQLSSWILQNREVDGQATILAQQDKWSFLLALSCAVGAPDQGTMGYVNPKA